MNRKCSKNNIQDLYSLKKENDELQTQIKEISLKLQRREEGNTNFEDLFHKIKKELEQNKNDEEDFKKKLFNEILDLKSQILDDSEENDKEALSIAVQKKDSHIKHLEKLLETKNKEELVSHKNKNALEIERDQLIKEKQKYLSELPKKEAFVKSLENSIYLKEKYIELKDKDIRTLQIEKTQLQTQNFNIKFDLQQKSTFLSILSKQIEELRSKNAQLEVTSKRTIDNFEKKTKNLEKDITILNTNQRQLEEKLQVETSLKKQLKITFQNFLKNIEPLLHNLTHHTEDFSINSQKINGVFMEKVSQIFTIQELQENRLKHYFEQTNDHLVRIESEHDSFERILQSPRSLYQIKNYLDLKERLMRSLKDLDDINPQDIEELVDKKKKAIERGNALFSKLLLFEHKGTA